MARLIVAMLLAALALAASGCGDDDETTAQSVASTSTSSDAAASGITKAAFIRRADTICTTTDHAIQVGAFRVFDGNASDAEIQRYADDVVIPAIENEIKSLQALPVPAGSEEQVDEIVAAIEDGLDDLKQDPVDIAGQPNDLGGVFDDANELMRAYGFEACGKF